MFPRYRTIISCRWYMRALEEQFADSATAREGNRSAKLLIKTGKSIAMCRLWRASENIFGQTDG